MRVVTQLNLDRPFSIDLNKRSEKKDESARVSNEKKEAL